MLIGVCPPFSSAAATVMGLSVLPGAKTLVAAMLRVASMLLGWLGLNVGYCAMARILPVPGCMTTIEQLRARATLTRIWHCRWASYWMVELMVSRRLRAGTGAR